MNEIADLVVVVDSKTTLGWGSGSSTLFAAEHFLYGLGERLD